MRRERLLVLDDGIQGSTLFKQLFSFGIGGGAFTATIQIVDKLPMSRGGVLRTYFMAFILVPFVAMIGPWLLLGTIFLELKKHNIELAPTANVLFGVVILCVIVLWPAYVVLRILDWSAGRHHVCPAKYLISQWDPSDWDDIDDDDSLEDQPDG